MLNSIKSFFPAAIEMIYDFFFLIWFVKVVNSFVDFFFGKLNFACITEIITNANWTRCIILFLYIAGFNFLIFIQDFLCHCL